MLKFADVAKRLNPAGDNIEISIDYSAKEITFGDGSKALLHKCPNTNLWYFYHPCKRKYLESDVEVQPRGLEQKRLRNLALNLRRNFQLSPTVCRLVTSENVLKVFDGQHKTTAQAIGNQNAVVDCKVFIDPPLEMVRRVVIEGHGPLRQQEFKTSELHKKLAANYLELLQKWLDSHPGRPIREVELPQALGKTKDEVNKEIIARIGESVINDANCEIADYVSEERRPPRDKPLSYDMFVWWVKSLIAKPPVEEPMESEENLREVERENIVRFLNHVSQKCLQSNWTPDNPNSVAHKKARKLFYRASFREWAKLMNSALRLLMFQGPEEPIFYRNVSPSEWQRIETACQKLVSHPIWMDPNPSVAATLNSNVQKNVAQLFREQKLNLEFLCSPN